MWDVTAVRRKLVGFNNHTIYRVHIKEQNKIIRIKDQQIFEDLIVNIYFSLSDFKQKPKFDRV